MSTRQKALPPDLLEAKNRFHNHPQVVGSQLFTTAQGEWGMRIQVRPGTPIPLPETRDLARQFDIVYETEPGPLPEARPAYPSRGE